MRPAFHSRICYAVLFGASAAAALARTMLYAHVLAPADFGAVALTILVAILAAYLGAAGISDGLASAIPLARGRGEDPTEMRSAGIFGVVHLSTLVGVATTVVGLILMHKQPQYVVLPLAGPLVTLTAILNTLFVDLQVRELNIQYAFLLLLKSSVPLILAVPLSRAVGSVGVLMAELVGSAVCVALFALCWNGRLRWSTDRRTAISLARLGAPYVTGNVLQNIAMNADRWAVQSTHGVSALGTYGFAMHFSSVGLVLLNMVQLYVSPRLLRRFGADGDTTALRRHSVRFAIFTAGTYAVTAVPLVFAFPRLLARYFPAYMGAAPLAPWVAIGTGAIALGFFDVLFRASGNGRPLALVQVIVAIVGFAAALVASALDSPLWVFALGFCCTRIVSTILGWVTGSRLLLQQTSTSPTSKT